MSIVSDNIKKWRTERGIKQSELAKLLGKASSVIANWEAGTNRPDVDSIQKMLEIFSIDANTFFGWEGQSVSTSLSLRPAELRIAKKLPQLTDEQLGRVEERVDTFIENNKKTAPKDGRDDGKGAVETSSISPRQKDA